MFISRRAAKNVFLHGSAQACTMGLAFATGILVIRELPKDDYAFYSVCIALVAALGLIGEAGVNSVILGRGGKRDTTSISFSYIITSAFAFRVRLVPPILLAGGTLISCMLYMTGASWPYIFSLTIAALISVWLVLNTGIYQNVQKLNLDFIFMRRLALLAGFLRLMVIALLAYTLDLNALGALLVGAAIYYFVYRIHRRRAQQAMTNSGQSSKRYFGYFRQAARRTLPMTLLLVASEQLVILILAANGSTTAIAEISALARFGIVFSLANVIFSEMAAPYIAKLNAPLSTILSRIAYLALLYGVFAGVILALLHATSAHLLGLLGSSYSHLSAPFIIILCGQALLNLGYATGYLVQARGWTMWSASYAFFIFIWLVCGISLLDLRTTQGAAVFMATQAIPNVLTQVVRIFAGTRSERK